MPGGRSRSFRLGDRSELLVEHLLAGVAFTTPVPRQEDIGVDFMCSLITGYDERANLLKAGPFFFVQAKSSAEAWAFEEPHGLEWIKNQENPILLCVADREAGAMDVYSTWNLLCGVLNGWRGLKAPTCIRLCPGRSGSDWRGVEDQADGSQDILLGKPIIRITHDQVFDEKSTRGIVEVISEWIALDRENITNRHAGMYWVVGPQNYRTGEPPSRDGIAIYWHPQNQEKCTLNLIRSADSLLKVLNHPGSRVDLSQSIWAERLHALEEVLRVFG